MRVIFARHGQSVANVEGVISNRDLPHGLTEVGRRQARLLGDRLRNEGIGALYCSPILRARETAEAVGAALSLTPVVVDGLREPDRGVLEGRADDEAWRRHDALNSRWVVDRDHAARIDGGESLIEVRQRFEAFLAWLLHRHDGDATVACISHGALLLTVLPLVLRGVPADVTASSSIGHVSTIVAVHRAAEWRCVTWCSEDTTPSG